MEMSFAPSLSPTRRSRAAMSTERQQNGLIKVLPSADEDSTRTSFSSASYIARIAVDGLRERKSRSAVPLPPRDTLYGAYQGRPPRERTPPRNQLAAYDARSPYAQSLSPTRVKQDKENTKNRNISTSKTRSSSSSSSSTHGKSQDRENIVSRSRSKTPRAESPVVQLERELAGAKVQHLEEQMRYAAEQHAQDARFHEAFSALKARPITRESTPVSSTERTSSSERGSAGASTGSGSGAGRPRHRASGPPNLTAGGGSLLGDFADDAAELPPDGVAVPVPAAAAHAKKPGRSLLPPTAPNPVPEEAAVGVDTMAALGRALHKAESEAEPRKSSAVVQRGASPVTEELAQLQQSELDSDVLADMVVGGGAGDIGEAALHALLTGQWRGILRRTLEADPDLQAHLPVMHVLGSGALLASIAPDPAAATSSAARSSPSAATPGETTHAAAARSCPASAADELVPAALQRAPPAPATAPLAPGESDSMGCKEGRAGEPGPQELPGKVQQREKREKRALGAPSIVVTPPAPGLGSGSGGKKRRSHVDVGGECTGSSVLEAVNGLHIPVRKPVHVVASSAPSVRATVSAAVWLPTSVDPVEALPAPHKPLRREPAVQSPPVPVEISPVSGPKHKHASRSGPVHGLAAALAADTVQAEAAKAAAQAAAEVAQHAARENTSLLEQTIAAVLATNKALHDTVTESALGAARECASDITAAATHAAVQAARQAAKDSTVVVMELAVDAAREAAVAAAQESASQLLDTLRADTLGLLSTHRAETKADVRELALKLRDLNIRLDGFVDEVFQQLACLRRQQQLGAAAVSAVAAEVRHVQHEQFNSAAAVAEVRAAVDAVVRSRPASPATASAEKERIKREIDTRFAALEAMEALISKAEAELDAEDEEEVAVAASAATRGFPVVPYEQEAAATAEAAFAEERSVTTDAVSEAQLPAETGAWSATIEGGEYVQADVGDSSEAEVNADFDVAAAAAVEAAPGQPSSVPSRGIVFLLGLFACTLLVLLSDKQLRAAITTAASLVYSLLVELHCLVLAAAEHAVATLHGQCAELARKLQTSGVRLCSRVGRTQLGAAILHKMQGLDPEL